METEATMKTVTMGSALALLISTNVYAADLNGGYKDKIPPVLSNETNWTGFYLGVHGGAGWGQLDSTYTDAGSFRNTPWDLTINHTNADIGALGGGQIGYNFQTGGLLMGIEADFGYLGLSQTRDIVSASFGTNNLALGTKLEGGLLADVTGRLGYVSGPALFYIKGGWAYLDGTASTSGIDALKIKGVKDVSQSSFDGWTIGGGLEYQLNSSWSIKAEYQHYDFGSFDFLPVAADPKVAIHNDLALDTVKVGLNYHFGNTYAPLK
jgi:outer membrane immunogenic protein